MDTKQPDDDYVEDVKPQGQLREERASVTEADVSFYARSGSSLLSDTALIGQVHSSPD